MSNNWSVDTPPEPIEAKAIMSNSDTSRQSPRDVLDYEDDDDHHSHCSSSAGCYSDKTPESIIAATPPSIRSASISPPRRQRSRSRARSRSRPRLVPPTSSNNSSRSRSRPPPPPPAASSSAAVSRASTTRSRSRPRTQSRARRSKSRSSRRRNIRFSYSRRSSLGGTTIYPTPAMATLDTHLRSTSGLRLQTDGTCNFLFEGQRFVIETSEEGGTDGDGDGGGGVGGGGEFLFYASFGLLRELQQRMNKPRQLLRMLATWNEELKHRGEEEEEGEGGGQSSSGLLRIDSSKSEGPHVAFIYYGHLDEITSSMHFQERLDDFVDDVLEFSEKLHGVKEESDEVPNDAGGGIKGGHMAKPLPPPPPPPPRTSTTTRETPTSTNPDGRSNFNKDNANHHQPPTLHQKEAAAAATPPFSTTTTNSSPNNSTILPALVNNGAITSTDIYNAHVKKSVFTKMIESLRSKTNNSSDNVANAFVDPNNSACAFVVDKNAAEEGRVKPTIVLSRGKNNKVGGGGGDEQQQQQQRSPARGGLSFDNREHQRDRYPQRGRSFHIGEDDTSDGYNPPPMLSSSARHSRPHRKSSSFAVDDCGGAPTKPHRKSSSFAVDDYSGNSSCRHPHSRQSMSFHNVDDRSHHRKKSSSTSFHMDDDVGNNIAHVSSYPTSNNKARSKSFHHTDSTVRSKRSSYLNEDSRGRSASNLAMEESDYEHSNQSIDVAYDQTTTRGVRGGAGGLLQSEPMVSQRYPIEPPPPPPPTRHHSRRHRSGGHTKPMTKRHSVHDEGRATANKSSAGHGSSTRNRSRSRHRNHNGSGRMNQSEPILSQHQHRNSACV